MFEIRRPLWLPFKYRKYIKTARDKMLMCRFRSRKELNIFEQKMSPQRRPSAYCSIKNVYVVNMPEKHCRRCNLWEHR